MDRESDLDQDYQDPRVDISATIPAVCLVFLG
jgi:hypothetical protein